MCKHINNNMNTTQFYECTKNATRIHMYKHWRKISIQNIKSMSIDGPRVGIVLGLWWFQAQSVQAHQNNRQQHYDFRKARYLQQVFPTAKRLKFYHFLAWRRIPMSTLCDLKHFEITLSSYCFWSWPMLQIGLGVAKMRWRFMGDIAPCGNNLPSQPLRWIRKIVRIESVGANAQAARNEYIFL